jgi:hypothetical protein
MTRTLLTAAIALALFAATADAAPHGKKPAPVKHTPVMVAKPVMPLPVKHVTVVTSTPVVKHETVVKKPVVVKPTTIAKTSPTPAPVVKPVVKSATVWNPTNGLVNPHAFYHFWTTSGWTFVWSESTNPVRVVVYIPLVGRMTFVM